MPVQADSRVLLVEDSGSTRKMEKMILGKLGFKNITEAEDGAIAIELLKTDQPFDLIISDWNMPNLDGLELLKWVRADEKRSATTFIMATGQGERKQTEVARQAGVSGIVAKPFSPDELKKILDEIEEHGIQKEQDLSVVRTPIVEKDGRVRLQIAHIQITDHLVLGALKHLIDTGEVQARHFTLETLRRPSWNPVRQELENAEIDAALVLAPIAMDAYAYGCPIRLVMLAHKNGSIMVRNRNSAGMSPKDAFLGRTFYIPHQLSIHHMFTHMYLKQLGLRPGVAGTDGVNVTLEVAPPIKMPEFLANNPKAGGFMVAEPLGTKAIAANSADLQFLSAEAWRNHPCCVVTFRKEIIDQHPEAVQEFSTLLVRAGRWIEAHPETASKVAVGFLDPSGELGLSSAVLKNVLTENEGITYDNLYPEIEDLDKMNEYMANEMGLGKRIDVDDFVDIRFANAAYEGRIPERTADAELSPEIMVKRINAARAGGNMTKVMLHKEGKYLLFDCGEERYGIGIMRMREVVGLQEIHALPNAPKWCPGVMNLRGSILPVLDLKSWFGYGATELHDRTPVIIVETNGRTKSSHMGILADSVAEIVDISADVVEAPPNFGDNTRYILAMARINEGVNVLLDVDQIVGSTSSKIN